MWMKTSVIIFICVWYVFVIRILVRHAPMYEKLRKLRFKNNVIISVSKFQVKKKKIVILPKGGNHLQKRILCLNMLYIYMNMNYLHRSKVHCQIMNCDLDMKATNCKFLSAMDFVFIYKLFSMCIAYKTSTQLGWGGMGGMNQYNLKSCQQ